MLIFFVFLLLEYFIFIRNNVFNRGKITQNLRGQQLKLITEALGSIKFIKLSNKENEFSLKFKNNLKNILSQNVF